MNLEFVCKALISLRYKGVGYSNKQHHEYYYRSVNEAMIVFM